jgi:DNA-binding CsgD family transcriptional regulator
VLLLLLPHLDAAYRRVRLAARLSDREREILSLVAEGMTNREIGEALYLSPLTVRTHLERIFAKLGVRTRTAAAAFAPEGDGRFVSARV